MQFIVQQLPPRPHNWVRMHMHIHIVIYTCNYIHVHIYIHIYIHTYIHIYICTYIYIYTVLPPGTSRHGQQVPDRGVQSLSVCILKRALSTTEEPSLPYKNHHSRPATQTLQHRPCTTKPWHRQCNTDTDSEMDFLCICRCLEASAFHTGCTHMQEKWRLQRAFRSKFERVPRTFWVVIKIFVCMVPPGTVLIPI